MRNQDKNEEEKKLMEELKALEQKIRREEKEQLNLKRILQFNDNFDENVDLNQNFPPSLFFYLPLFLIDDLNKEMKKKKFVNSFLQI